MLNSLCETKPVTGLAAKCEQQSECSEVQRVENIQNSHNQGLDSPLKLNIHATRVVAKIEL